MLTPILALALLCAHLPQTHAGTAAHEAESAAHQLATIRAAIVDVSGAAVSDATVLWTVNGDERSILPADDGTFEIAATGLLLVRADGFADVSVDLARRAQDATRVLRIVLSPARVSESVVVQGMQQDTRLPSAASATVITSAELANSAAGALDDVLRQTPGFTLFRRASSRTANPTTQGVTLRGVSGSGASRTLVLADGVPLNDPFGSWVYWNRIPSASIDRVEVVRGGAGDLHGADALGGVIQVVTFSPQRPRLRASVEGASHSTVRGSLFAGTTLGAWTATLSGEWLGTDGVLTIGDESRGPVDVRADSDYRTGAASFGTQRPTWRLIGRLGVYDEDRGNGTPVQVNTTAWRQYSLETGGPAGPGAWEARTVFVDQDYFQTFSAVATPGRASERLTTEQWTPSRSLTGQGQYAMSLGPHVLVGGVNFSRITSSVEELRYVLQSGNNLATGPFVVGGDEASVAEFGRLGLVLSDRLTVNVGLRHDYWQTSPSSLLEPTRDEHFFSPRAGASVRLGTVQVQGAVYRSHRTPTLNELYRGFRVGNVLTNPNAALEPETLTGVEAGALVTREQLSLRATAFTNLLDRAIANFTVGQQGVTIIRERRNSDEIRATGLEVESDIRLHPMVTVNAQVTFTSSHFRGSLATPALEGNRVPQVPRIQFGAGVSWAAPQELTLAMQFRGSGKQFDDDLNTPSFELAPYAVVDVLVSRRLTRALQGFAAVENLLDEDYDTGRTPLRTIGWPRTVRAGVRLAIP